ncbi:chemotaxis protein CheD [Herbaspirillum sp. Sphag1AN]|uniref:chemoreceptor glutamine deamidase CheD n=1 Tax=unclassified Herbaspirillum TaxID=2624150 RepID=UPI001610FEA9|nr:MULTISPECIES: chemoreceptor glutamine deamidase CheD [unclassified Herbaspirillum]MBB3214560.1 chemotaxis protein CheD [Herbaspirillum sp. Sphag1AN]MBB3247706.1 chemotaxis protein CheD [Herbaspirillum sp. Sphag64]
MSANIEQFASHIYHDRSFNCHAAKILPGEYYFTRDDMMITTVLGSCVSACIRDRVSGIGGMNHFMLPDGGNDADSPISSSMRYGTYAMEILINEVLKAGARRENLEAKVFGGGAVLRGFNAINVGERNAKFVRDYLRTENIRITAEDLNDIWPRKVNYFPRSGKVMVKKLKSTDPALEVKERDYAGKLAQKPVGGDIDLF